MPARKHIYYIADEKTALPAEKREFKVARKKGRRAPLLAIAATLVISALSPALYLLFGKTRHTDALTLTTASGVSETEESTTSATFVATDTSIAAASLPAGTYLVAWGAATANSQINSSTFARLMRGTTEIAMSGSENNNAPGAYGGRGVGGYWLGSLSGSEALSIEFRRDTQTAYIDSKFIKAIRLDNRLTADTHYFTSGSQEAGTDEVSNAGTAGFTNVKSLTKTFDAGSAQNYLVLASMEMSPDSVSNDCKARLVVDGTASFEHSTEGEDNSDILPYMAADLMNIGSGSRTISLEGQSIDGATCDFLRSRIYVFKASVFDQIQEAQDNTESTLASATWTTKNSVTYTPNQPETVMALTNNLAGTDSANCAIATRIQNATDTTTFADTIAFNSNNATADYGAMISAMSESLTGAKTYNLQYQRSDGNCTVKLKEARLIIWSMTLNMAYTQSNYRWYGNADSVQPGNALAAENSAVSTDCGQTSPLRLRLNVLAGSAAVAVPANSERFILQYAVNSTSGTWTDVGGAGQWAFKDNTTPTSGATVSSNLLTSTTDSGTYQEANPTATNPTALTANDVIEFDFSLDPTNVTTGTYYFRLIIDSGAVFDTYTNYPQITVDDLPSMDRVMRHGATFTNGQERAYACNWISNASQFVDFAGTAGDTVSTPDSALNSTTSSLDIRTRASADAWAPAEAKYLAAKADNTTNLAWVLQLDTAGTLTLNWWNATVQRGGTSSATVASAGVSDGRPIWIRATAVGSSGTIQFFTSADGKLWDQLGSNVAGGGTGIDDTNQPITLGMRTGVTTANRWAGNIYAFQLLNVIDGFPVAHFDATRVDITGAQTPTTVTGSTGETWTASGTAWAWGGEPKEY